MSNHSHSNSNGQHRPDVVRSVGDVVSDVVSLTELQIELLLTDCTESRRKLFLPLIVFAIGMLMFAGCFPVLLLAMALLINDFAELPMAASLGISAAVDLLLTLLLIWIGARGMTRALTSFERTSTELRKNVDWLKQLKSRNGISRHTHSTSGSW